MMYPIALLIPQRPPMLLVDELLTAGDDHCTTAYTVDAACCLVAGGCLTEIGVMEHMAQSAAALAGYHSVAGETGEMPLGMIGEVRHFSLYALPRVGQRLVTRIAMGISVGAVTGVTAETTVEGEVIARTQLKIALAPHPHDTGS